MKKQEIKRRKRVVPASSDNATQAPSSVAGYSPPQRATQTPAYEHSVSPDPTTAIETSENDIEPPEPRGPVAIDFTNYYSNASATSRPPGPPTPSTIQPRAPSPRKRSLSATLDQESSSTPAPVPHRPNDISSLLNPSKPQDSNIDPSLSNMSRHTGPSPGLDGRPRASPVSLEDKLARKERLRREAEAMREELARKEKELEELDD